MAQLIQQKCVACRADSPAVTDAELKELQPQVLDWTLIVEGGIRKLDRAYKLPNFAQALAFAKAVGDIAEEEGHHPRLTVEWGKVAVTWWTHKIKNLHRNDFIMAAKTDQAFQKLAEAQ
jgi:4a-hydroxytetrahydrobiopterin dehydratase